MSFWLDPLSPLGSAVRYIAALSPSFDWVGIYLLKGSTLILGPYLGEATEHAQIKIGKGICGTAVAMNKDLNVPDVSKEENYLACSIKTKSELVVLIRDQNQKVVAQIDIDSHTLDAFNPTLEKAVREIAKELGDRWHTFPKAVFSRKY